jgi:hypothetical protein
MSSKTTTVYARLEIPGVSKQSQSNVDRAIACGDLETFISGRKRYVTDAALQKWLAFLIAESAAGRPVKYMARNLAERRTPERAKAERARQRRRASA